MGAEDGSAYHDCRRSFGHADAKTPYTANARDLRRIGRQHIDADDAIGTHRIGPIHTVGSSGFGQIRSQSGFMRMTQLMFRMTF